LRKAIEGLCERLQPPHNEAAEVIDLSFEDKRKWFASRGRKERLCKEHRGFLPSAESVKQAGRGADRKKGFMRFCT